MGWFTKDVVEEVEEVTFPTAEEVVAEVIEDGEIKKKEYTDKTGIEVQ